MNLSEELTASNNLTYAKSSWGQADPVHKTMALPRTLCPVRSLVLIALLHPSKYLLPDQNFVGEQIYLCKLYTQVETTTNLG